jgi:IS5 family transposase
MLKNVLLKTGFFNQINIVINWNSVSNMINEHYTVGLSATGTPSTDGLLLFKMLLIGIWYGLSDRDVEDMVSENLSAMKFCGLQLENNVPDHTVLSRFRTKLTEENAFEPLLI